MRLNVLEEDQTCERMFFTRDTRSQVLTKFEPQPLSVPGTANTYTIYETVRFDFFDEQGIKSTLSKRHAPREIRDESKSS